MEEETTNKKPVVEKKVKEKKEPKEKESSKSKKSVLIVFLITLILSIMFYLSANGLSIGSIDIPWPKFSFGEASYKF